jgi:hypothetical protein
MKHISESIIGKRGNKQAPPLANLDIVEIRDGYFYVIFLDKDDFWSINDRLKWRKPGILYSKRPQGFVDADNFLWFEDYTKNLEYVLDGDGMPEPKCDIVRVWRPKNPRQIPELFDIKYLKWLVEKSLLYFQIFER